MKPFISVSSLTGFVAMYCARQSPYHAPDGLVEVLRVFYEKAAMRTLPEFPKDWPVVWCDRMWLKSILVECLISQPQVQAWNQRKNGNDAPYNFVSRYDGPRDPDDDFIDLDALVGNIVREALEYERRETAENAASLARTKPALFRAIDRIFKRGDFKEPAKP